MQNYEHRQVRAGTRDSHAGLRLIHVRGMRRKGHPYRQRQISAPEESGATDQNVEEVSTTRPSPIGSTGLHNGNS